MPPKPDAGSVHHNTATRVKHMSTVRPVSQLVPSLDAQPRAGRPRNPAVDIAILQAARLLLEEVGCGAFTMEGVATQAGVGKQALYRRWPSKGDLLIDLYYRDSLTDPDVDEAGLSFAEAFGRFLDANLQRLYSPWHHNLLRSLATTAQNDPTMRRTFLARITQPRMESGRRLLRRAVAAGHARADLDIEMVLDFAVGAIWFRLLFADEPVTPALRNRILRGVMTLCVSVGGEN